MSIDYGRTVTEPAAKPATGHATGHERPGRVERRPATDEEARALTSTLRMRILRVCLGEAHTNKEIAQTLGKDPATVLHHVRRLVDTGFLAAQDVRRGPHGAREIPYLTTGKSWQLSMPSKSPVLLNTFLDELGLVPAESVETTRLGLRLSAAERKEFERRLFGLLDEYATRADSPDGQAISLFLAIHPDPNRS